VENIEKLSAFARASQPTWIWAALLSARASVRVEFGMVLSVFLHEATILARLSAMTTAFGCIPLYF
jgi:hypothetical protein